MNGFPHRTSKFVAVFILTLMIFGVFAVSSGSSTANALFVDALGEADISQESQASSKVDAPQSGSLETSGLSVGLPDTNPNEPRESTNASGEGLVISKTVSPDTAPPNAPTTIFLYTIAVENASSADPVPLNEISDGVPDGFSYVDGSSMIDGTPFTDPTIQTLLFDEGDPSNFETMLTWDLSQLGIMLALGESVTLTFESQATNLVEGLYCNESWTEPVGSQTRTDKTATITVGTPLEANCVGSELKARQSAIAMPNPSQDPSDPNDDIKVTYTVTIENTGAVSYGMWWLRDRLPPGFNYSFGSTTGDFTSSNPFALKLFGRQRLNWFFLFPTIDIGPAQTRTLIFDAVAPDLPGDFDNEIWFFFVGFNENDAIYSWPGARVSLLQTQSDVAVTTVTASPTTVNLGEVVLVDAVLENLGNRDVGSFNVTLNDLTDGVTIDTKVVPGIAVGATDTVAFSWDTTGAGVTTHTLEVSHDFADDDAANDSAQTDVTVDSLLNFTEDWTGANGSPWPSQWSFDNAVQAKVIDISNNWGRLGKVSSDPGPNNVTAYINSAQAENVDQTTTFNISANAMRFGMMARRDDADSDTYYYSQVVSRKSRISIYKVVDGSSTQLGIVSIPVVSRGVDWIMRFVVETSGSTTMLKAKVWSASASEPAAFDIEFMDAEPRLQNVTGRFGFRYELFRNRVTHTDDYVATIN